MITFYLPKGDTLFIRVTGYEFPDIAEDYDANWVIIDVDLQTADGQWRAESPCVLTWNLIYLQNWLNEIHSGAEPTRDSWSGLENDLVIEYVRQANQQYHFRVGLAYDLRPEWIDDTRFWSDASLNRAQLEQAIAALQMTIQSFPPRGELGNRLSDKFKNGGNV